MMSEIKTSVKTLSTKICLKHDLHHHHLSQGRSTFNLNSISEELVVVAAQVDGCGFDEAAYRHQPHILPFSSTVDLLSLEAARSTSKEE